MINQHKIIWEKWKDPLGYDDQEVIESEGSLDHPEMIDEDDEENHTFIDKKIKKIKCHMITTPFGIIPINENTASSEIFNFWTGHSNFPITKEIADIIENTDGIETLNIFTKYRFRIAVGKAFIDSEVMRSVNHNVYNFLEN